MAQLCNKKNGHYFDVLDEEVAMVFSIYCGISIMHSLVYGKVQEAQARNQLINELMIYHMKVCAEKCSLGFCLSQNFLHQIKGKVIDSVIYFSFSNFENFMIITITLHVGVMSKGIDILFA